MRRVFDDKTRDERRQAYHAHQSHRLQGQHERHIDLRGRARDDGYRVEPSGDECAIYGRRLDEDPSSRFRIPSPLGYCHIHSKILSIRRLSVSYWIER
jgi:hypothetical protein